MTIQPPTPAIPRFDHAAMALSLIADEGDARFVYDDATGHAIGPGSTVIGHPTIGIGRALDTAGIDRTESRVLLGNDILRYVRELAAFPWWTALDPIRQRAIVNMRHQLGLNGLLGFHDLIAALTVKDWPEAQRAGLNSVWARQTPDRAERVMAMIRTGEPPNGLGVVA